MQQPEERGMALVVGQREEAAVWGEVQAVGSVYGFPLEHGEVGEHREAGDMNQSGSLVVSPGGNGQDLGGGVEAERGGRVHQVHDGLQRLGVVLPHTLLLRVHVHHTCR